MADASDYAEHHSYDHDIDEDVEARTCGRCNGNGYVPLLLESAYESYDGEAHWGERDCPTCGGAGVERDAAELSELRAFGGPGWDE